MVSVPHDAVGAPVTVTDGSLPDSCAVNLSGKPDAGNPPVRFDEGDQVYAWSLLYRPPGFGKVAMPGLPHGN